MAMSAKERIERTAALLARPATIATRPVWIDCQGWLRIGRTDDMIQMLCDLGIPTRAG